MTLQRVWLQVAKQSLARSILKPNNNLTFCVIQHRNSSNKRKYNIRHEWVSVNKGTGTVGISNYAQESLGDVVFAQLPDPGTPLSAGDECGTLESVKAASEIYTPVSGEVIEKNKKVEQKPALVNTSCYEDGWLFTIKLTNVTEVDNLMTEQEYLKFLETDVKEKEE